jgi:hypothetical protein
MVKKMLFCVFCLVNLYACGEKSAKTPAIVESPTMKRPIFAAKTSVDTLHEDDTPRTVISIIWKEQVMVLDTMIGTFNPVDSSQYVRHRIPKTAIATGTGFWAGLGTTYFIDSTATAWVIKRKYEEEGDREDSKDPYFILKTLPFQK